jgi:hypothetical protein
MDTESVVLLHNGIPIIYHTYPKILKKKDSPREDVSIPLRNGNKTMTDCRESEKPGCERGS